MKNIPEKNYFYKVNKSDLPHGMIEALVVAYVLQFTEANKPCFASRKTIAEALHSSPATIQRAIDKLVKLGRLTCQKQGRKRLLHVYHSDTGIGIKLIPNRYQNDTLFRSTYSDPDYSSTNINNNNIYNTYIAYQNDTDQKPEASELPKTDTLNAAAAKFGLRKRWE